MSDTTRTTGAIDVPYDPDRCIGDFGWIWMTTTLGEEWLICRTVEDDDDGALLTEVWGPDATSDTHDAHAAEELRGTPYLPMAAPACTPGAGFEAQVHLAGGGVIRYGLDASEDATATRERVLAALQIGGAPEP